MALTFDKLPDDVESLKALILAARAKTAVQEAVHARLSALHAIRAAEVVRLTAQNERLDHFIKVLRRAQFGRKSERICDEQMALALEDIETAFGAEDAAAEKANDTIKRNAADNRRANRGSLPKHLPREEFVIEPESKACQCCGLYPTPEALERVVKVEDAFGDASKAPTFPRLLWWLRGGTCRTTSGSSWQCGNYDRPYFYNSGGCRCLNGAQYGEPC